ncbi:class I SAM-dependent methyltransferase [Simiduia sp. 21SJ11W-1]|uniref:class I SAM-dependent methyltransferase n=1 Tax=Simiduia sp. 21SJ11W-1 TaxID=2909669 RepID=UPI00209EE854|nr:class I SAM-dependent methyltransferase [Simiduia sp. 21SJ11W-1]UTA46675.1 class I SAM-dependent methyltransferase [Simiduia sp. 21SJ11W-1]
MLCPVIYSNPALAEAATNLAARLAQPCLGLVAARDVAPATYVLALTEAGLQLQQTGAKAHGPVWVDFNAGSADHRRQYGGGRGQMIAKAVGLKTGIRPQVLDATAGLGGDAFVLASLGASLVMQERNPIVHALLGDGLARLGADARAELQAVHARMQLLPHGADSTRTMPRAQVIYLDPMFPAREKSAAVKKEMAAFHNLVGEDDDQATLLDLALAQAEYRVVVKRPRKAPALAGREPTLSLAGKSSRFDIYPLKKMPEGLVPA